MAETRARAVPEHVRAGASRRLDEARGPATRCCLPDGTSPVNPTLVRHLRIAALSGTLLLATAAPAAAEPPCWKVLINDWYDGQIDGVYAVSCYREALEHLPDDLEIYSRARDDISQALQARLQGGSGSTDDRGATASGPPFGRPGPGGPGSAGPGSPGRRDPNGPVPNVLRDLGSDDADSVPIPLIVLASVALLLLAAGTAGFVARRIQARRVQIRPAPESPPAQKS